MFRRESFVIVFVILVLVAAVCLLKYPGRELRAGQETRREVTIIASDFHSAVSDLKARRDGPTEER